MSGIQSFTTHPANAGNVQLRRTRSLLFQNTLVNSLIGFHGIRDALKSGG
jgi:hypothetical protein